MGEKPTLTCDDFVDARMCGRRRSHDADRNENKNHILSAEIGFDFDTIIAVHITTIFDN